MAQKQKLTGKGTRKPASKSVIHQKSSYHTITIKTKIVNDDKTG